MIMMIAMILATTGHRGFQIKKQMDLPGAGFIHLAYIQGSVMLKKEKRDNILDIMPLLLYLCSCRKIRVYGQGHKKHCLLA